MNYLTDGYVKFSKWFQQNGWYLLMFLPLLDLAGRALFNIVFFVFVLLALMTAAVSFRLPKFQMNLFIALHLSIFMSLVFTHNIATLYQPWLKYAAEMSTFFILLYYLRNNLVSIQHIFNWMGGVAVLTIVVTLTIMLIQWIREPNIAFAVGKVNKDVLPWLIPFAIPWAYQHSKPQLRWLAVLGLIAITLFIGVGTQGRTALLATMLATSVLFVMYFRVRFWQVALALILVVGSVAAVMPNVLRGALDAPSAQTLDRLTSGRAVLWRQAIQHPPENPWVGIGFGNKEGKAVVTYIGEEKVKHLHNLFMDCWYEIGYFGLGAFILWLGYHCVLLVRIRQKGNDVQKKQAAILCASVVAMMVEGMFAVSMNSRMFAVYLCMVFALATYMTASQNIKEIER
ncbi:MAG: O-antigen ligase family protein [Methylococcaceae bacterium]|nr:O-antigen ligase family protein [Methylococcaceae bacterium]